MMAMKVNIFWQLQTWHSSAWIVTLSIFTWTILSTLLVIPVEGKKCPGKCIYNVTDCKEKGGKVAGYCTNELACCDYSYKKMGSCGSKMNKLTTALFRSPDFPEYSTGDLTCQFEFSLNSNATGVIVEYSDILMDGRGFMKNSACEADMFVLKGFPDWTPPIQCGNLSNYAAVIDLGTRFTKGMKSLTILALMSSKKYRWNIKVTQLYTDRSHPSIKMTSTATTTEISAKRRDKDNDEDEEDESEDSPYNLLPNPNPKMNAQFAENYEESEEEEVHRILHVTSALKASKNGGSSILPIGGEYIMPGGDEGQQDYNYPAEETFIVNGDDTEISTVPWQASLRTLVSPRIAKLLPQLKMKNCTIDEGIHFCGGSIISDRHILSATHCFLVGEKLSTWQRTSSMKIVLGDSNLCDENKEGVQELKVEKVYFHYAYDTEAIINDMVVIKVDRKIRFTNKIKSVKMAEVDMKFEHQFAFASGWGLTNLTSKDEHRGTPDQLQSADDMFIGNSSDCMDEQLKLYPQVKSQSLVKYPKYGDVFSSLICTYIRNGSLSRMVGQGDSGGPLVVYPKLGKSTTEKPRNKSGGGKSKNNKSSSEGSSSSSSNQKNEPLLVGVISFMIPIPHEKKVHDVSNYVDFYQSVSYYRKWIDLAMQL